MLEKFTVIDILKSRSDSVATISGNHLKFNIQTCYDLEYPPFVQVMMNAKDKQFVEGFVTASLTVCIGAMAIVGALKDGLEGDSSVLVTKAVLDFIIILVMTGSLGKGCAFSAIPVAILQGSITLLAGLVKPVMTEAALGNLSTVGSVLIFCVGVNLVWGKTVRVANLLPAIVIAAAMAFLPFGI